VSVAQRLATLLADVAQRKRTAEADEIGALVDALDDETGLEDFFTALSVELARRGAKLPPLEQLPASIAELLAAAGPAFAAATIQLDAPARARREAALDAEIREHAATSVADSLRRHGLVPAADVPEPPDDDH
jgi:hypothetical protein